jgi:hypothetical protein
MVGMTTNDTIIIKNTNTWSIEPTFLKEIFFENGVFTIETNREKEWLDPGDTI